MPAEKGSERFAAPIPLPPSVVLGELSSPSLNPPLLTPEWPSLRWLVYDSGIQSLVSLTGVDGRQRDREHIRRESAFAGDEQQTDAPGFQ